MSQTLASLPPENEDGRGVVRRLHPLPGPPSSDPEPRGDITPSETLEATERDEGADHPQHAEDEINAPDDATTVAEPHARSFIEGLKTGVLELPTRFKSLSRRNQILAGCAGIVVTLGLVSGVSHLTHSSAPARGGQEVGYADAPPPVPTAAPHASPAPQDAPAKPAATADEHNPSSPAAASPPAPTDAPQEPGISTPAQSANAQAPADDLSAMLALKKPGPAPKAAPVVAPPVGPTAQTVPAPPPAAPAPDPVHIAASLQAAPMSDAQQTQVLGLVTEVAHLVEQQREELAQLRARLDIEEKASHDTDHDLTRRVSLLEAGAAVRDARAPRSEAGETRHDDVDRARSAVASARHDAERADDAPREVATAPVSARPTWTPRYRIVAASPQLAMLEDTAAPDGEVARVEAGPGTDLRGLGRILSISQKGTVWVIHTAHGDVY
ncbi:hypothetical protein GOB87_12525 [Acetobacter estunensis]|uniref:Uncharacterized protein n=2 Tax=Acetobacter estunensis TaxID=104097 RepID=A0A967ECL6_9PROT|nr:hypothetical protein [Acetobacter estunensis]NHO54758.1 hypothetical protein [Acetobacter estunensis]